MSVVVNRNDLSDDQVDIIRKTLVIHPKPQGKYEVRNPPPPVIFYNVKSITEKDKNGNDIVVDKVYLPYNFACRLLGKHLNHLPEVASRYPNVKINFKGTLREQQVKWTTETLGYIKNHGTTTIVVPPGSGKTVMGAWTTCQLGLPTCVIYNKTILARQWKKSFEDNTDALIWNFLEEPCPPGVNVILCLDQRVCKLPEACIKGIGLLIIDECHRFNTTSHVDPILAFQPKYILAESATPERDDAMHRMMNELVGTSMVYSPLSLKYTVLKLNTGIEPPIKLNRSGDTDYTALKQSLMYNPQRNIMLIQVLEKYPDKKTMIITSENNHVVVLEEMIKNNVTLNVDSLHDKKKTFKNCRILIGNVQMLGEGFDMANACPDYDGVPVELVIIFISIKNEALLYQVCGRGFRSKDPIIVHMVDNNKILTNHWEKAKKWHTKVGATIYEYNLF